MAAITHIRGHLPGDLAKKILLITHITACATLGGIKTEPVTPTNELSCFGAELLTASLKPTEADCQSSNTTSAGRCVERKEVKVKLNRDANQRIDFIWRRALRVSQTDGELSVQACAELQRKEVKAKLNGDANQRIDFIWRRALRVSQTDGELSEQSCAELRDEVFICDRLRVLAV
ncbi:hypothetical protein Bbelb_281890 [Branchiostoma belcheri]|nr:hypothetical protein Bbelb_281890 [Branchiostoma belcheri]